MPRHRRMIEAPKRATEWVTMRTNFTDLTASQVLPLGALTGAQLERFMPCTITRTVGLLSVAFDANFVTNQVYSGAIGLATLREDSRASGVNLNPFTDSGDDIWFVHQFFAGVLDDRVDSDLVLHQNFIIDSKAQRKLVDGDAIGAFVEGGGETDGFDAALFLRILLKLH